MKIARKKMLTVLGFVGILACGACFLPPPRSHATLPPELAAVQRIIVQVEDATGSNPFDSALMSTTTAAAFNQLWSEFPIRAQPGTMARTTDAVLQIRVLRKSTSCTADERGVQICTATLVATTTLSFANGQTRQSAPMECPVKFAAYYSDVQTEDLTASPFLRQAAFSLANRAGAFIFYGRSQ